jgi:DNA-binding FadR family transcriptional regulator
MSMIAGSREGGSLHSRVVDTLGQEIVDGIIPVGAILSPDDLCTRFGVSRSVVRESLRALESMGMTLARPQVGTRVLPQSDWNLLHPQVVAWRGRGVGYLDQMEQVLEVRFGIELVASRLAARRMSDEAVEKLLATVDAMTAAATAGDGGAYLDADAEFHRLILEGSGNVLISQFSRTVAAVVQTRRQDLGRTITELTPASLSDHRKLAKAIARRNPASADSALRAVVMHTLNEFRESRGKEQVDI